MFGMNFQAVSVGQKLAKDNSDGSCTDDTSFTGQPGGYLDGSGTPTPVLEFGLRQTDAALARMIAALKSEGIYDSTLFIVTAKHEALSITGADGASSAARNVFRSSPSRCEIVGTRKVWN